MRIYMYMYVYYLVLSNILSAGVRVGSKEHHRTVTC